MLTKHNITDIIADHKTRIFCKKLEYAWAKTEEEKLRIQTELDFLEDNCCRYEMQARAWGKEIVEGLIKGMSEVGK